MHVVQSPKVFLIFWDPYFTATPDACALMTEFVNDLLTGTYIRGLFQYGVRPGWVIGSAVIDMTRYPVPAGISSTNLLDSADKVQDQLIQWIKDGIVPAPDPVELQKVYFVFAPLSSGHDTEFCGFHEHGSYNAGSQGDNLFWGVTRAYWTASTAKDFVDTISYCVSHELAETFTNPTGGGYYSDENGCEIGDLCESFGRTDDGVSTVPYGTGAWQVERYWSQAGTSCVLPLEWPLTWTNYWASLQAPSPNLINLEVSRNQDGRLELFACGTDGNLWHRWQTAPNNGWTSQWGSLGHPAAVTIDTAYPGQTLAVGANHDGRLEAFVPAGGQLWHIWQTAPNGGWSEWALLAPPNPHFAVDRVKVANNDDGRFNVFVQNSFDGSLWQIWQRAVNGAWSTVWNQLGPPAGLSILGEFSVAQNGDGTLELLVVCSDGNLWSVRQTKGHFLASAIQRDPKNVGWGPWTLHGAAPQSVTDVVSIQANQDGRLEAFLFGNGGYWHTWQIGVGSWSGSWHQLGVPPNGLGGAFAAARDLNGCIEVFAWGGDLYLWKIMQTAASNGWGNWQSVRPDPVVLLNPLDRAFLRVGKNLDRSLEVFAYGQKGIVYHIWQID
jgi:hypothetical protein